MVSVKRCSLPSEYIDAAHKLVSFLSGTPFTSNGTTHTLNNGDGYNIDYAFFYLQYDDDQEWINGDWRLLIASNNLDHCFEGTRIVLDAIKLLNIDLPEFDFSISRPFAEHFSYYFDRINIKEYSS